MDTKDTKDARTPQEVDALIQKIKGHMPETYRAIQAKAQAVGKQAFAWVRRGLRGEPNCFYAVEAGRVMGTPFDLERVPPEVAQFMVQFGCAYMCIWPDAQAGDVGGA